MVEWKIVVQGRSCIEVVLLHVVVKDDVEVNDVVSGKVIDERIGMWISEEIGDEMGVVIGNLG